MMLSEAINKGKNIHKQAKNVEFEKKKSRPITKNGFVQYFYSLYSKYDYGVAPVVTKDTLNKVSGLIKVLKNNGYESEDFYILLDNIFKKWQDFKGKEVKTNKRKLYILDDKPNLMDIINCRDDILGRLHEKPKTKEKEMSLLEMWENR